MMISVHLPKTAGQSFLKTLKDHFGDGLRKDYADRPLNHGAAWRNASAVFQRGMNELLGTRGAGCVHGHFLPVKYLPLRRRERPVFVTWVRDPVERLASQYHHWKRNVDPLKMNRIQKKLLAEDWSLEDFCLSPLMKNVYAQFLWGFPVEKFDFVGATEHFDEDLDVFTRMFLGGRAPAPRVNVNPDANGRVYVEDPAFRRRVEDFHADDMAFYRWALKRREDRSSRGFSGSPRRDGAPLSARKDEIFAGPGPLVIGGTGGSGTRVLAEAVRAAGCFIGDRTNEALDTKAFGAYGSRGLQPKTLGVVSKAFDGPGSFWERWLDRWAASAERPLPRRERAAMEEDFLERMAWHLETRPSPGAPWGWKNPRSIYLLSFFNEVFPAMRFIHLVRDGRDMALSENQNQLRWHGDAVLGKSARGLPVEVRSAILWNRVNLAAAEYGETMMGSRYLRVRFEDLCAEPAAVMRRVWGFLGFSAAVPPEKVAETVSSPRSIGRWKACPDPDLMRTVTELAREGLSRFGYFSDADRTAAAGQGSGR